MNFNQKMIESVTALFADPLFKKGFLDFFLKTQQEGIESAKRFWNGYRSGNLFPDAPDLFEKLVDFYIILGFVPRLKYEEALKEQERLKEQNGFLRDTLSDIQTDIFKEGGKRMQDAWETIIDRQLELHKEITKNFFALFRQLRGTV